MGKSFLILGSVLAGTGVILGAFGAHGLKKIATEATIASYQTGVQYQLYHALAILCLGILMRSTNGNYLNLAGYSFLAGILLFSGSIYTITVLKSMNKVVPTAVGIITPIGGLFFISGWLLLTLSVLKN